MQELTKSIKFFILLFTIIAGISYLSGISVVTVGGLYLILGAFYMYFGKIGFASMAYVLSDIAWAINAYTYQDYFGFLVVLIGVIVGISVMYKMKQGIFVVDLHK